VPIDVEIADIYVFIGIDTHRWADLLIIDVISPWSDSVRLVYRNINRYYLNCWFDTEDTEDGPGELEDYNGFNSSGNWIIQVAQWTGHYDFIFESWAVEVVTRPTSAAGDDGKTPSFGVLATYPNPANASIKFEFAISQPGLAALDIYNVLGQRVAVVCQGAYKEGRHSAIWDASGMASGPYYYVLSSGGRKSQGRITLLK
jgi:subtilisin-like proprotein convertase family protein